MFHSLLLYSILTVASFSRGSRIKKNSLFFIISTNDVLSYLENACPCPESSLFQELDPLRLYSITVFWLPVLSGEITIYSENSHTFVILEIVLCFLF